VQTLPVPGEHLCVPPLPALALGRPQAVSLVPLVPQAPMRPPRRRHPAQLPVLVHRFHNPLNSGVASYCGVTGVHADNLVVLVRSVLVDPVRVEHAQATHAATHTLLRHAAQVAHKLKLGNTMVLGFPVNYALGDRSFTTPTAHRHTKHAKPLLGLVPQRAGLVGAGGVVNTVKLGQLTVFPSSNTQQKTKDVRLLFAP